MQGYKAQGVIVVVDRRKGPDRSDTSNRHSLVNSADRAEHASGRQPQERGAGRSRFSGAGGRTLPQPLDYAT